METGVNYGSAGNLCKKHCWRRYCPASNWKLWYCLTTPSTVTAGTSQCCTCCLLKCFLKKKQTAFSQHCFHRLFDLLCSCLRYWQHQYHCLFSTGVTCWALVNCKSQVFWQMPSYVPFPDETLQNGSLNMHTILTSILTSEHIQRNHV